MKNFLLRHPLLRRAFLLLLIYLSFHAATLEIGARRKYKRVAMWPETQAVIRSSEVYWTSYSWSGKSNRYCPRLEYEYTVNGKSYHETNQVFDFVCWPNAYDFVAQHQPDTPVRVAYDPEDPRITVVPDSVRDPGNPWGDVIGGFVLLALFLFDLFGSWTTESAGEITSHVG